MHNISHRAPGCPNCKKEMLIEERADEDYFVCLDCGFQRQAHWDEF